MLSLLLILLLVIVFLIGKRYLLQLQEDKLRDNPPKRRIIEVSLPRDISDSRLQMARFWRQVASSAQGDSKARKEGLRQLDFVYWVEVPAPEAAPEMKCLIYADEDRMNIIKKSIKQTFKGVADVIELEEDPMQEAIQGLRRPKKEEAS